MKKYFLTNKSKATKIKSIVHNGQDYFIVPAVLAKVGVMNNVLYTKELLSNTKDAWNGVKVTLRHPQFDGHDASINTPATADAFAIGELYNVTFDDDKLKGDIYLNKSVVEAKGAVDLIERLKNNEYIDVSTGLVNVTIKNEDGEFDGKKYKAIINTFKADHLAILPDEKGACSVKDGCGTLFNSELSFGQITEKIYSAMGKKDGWLAEVYEDYFIWTDNGKLSKIKYSIDGELLTIGSTIPVKKEILYVDIQTNKDDKHCECKKILTNTEKDVDWVMKKQTIEFLVNAELSGITDDEKKAIDNLSVETLASLSNKIKPETDKEFITNAEKKEFEDFKKKKTEKEAEKKAEFKKVFNCDDAMLNGLSIETIEHLINQKKAETPTDATPDYSGKGGGVVTNSQKINTKPISMAEMFSEAK